MLVDVCCRFEEIVIMMSSIERGEWYTNSVCHSAERIMRCGHGLSIILNLPIELFEIDRYAFNSGGFVVNHHSGMSPFIGSLQWFNYPANNCIT